MSDTTPPAGRGTAFRIAAATAAFALVHSVLASRRAKQAARRAAGDRARDGWYRAAYNAQAVATSAALGVYVLGLPDRTLYDVRGPLRVLMRAGQLAGVALLAQAMRDVGAARLVGATSLAAWSRGEARVPPEPEAQGPAPDPDGPGLRTSGAFALSRHPLNFAPVPVLWLNPRMTANLVAFNAAATLYFAVGSWHEERRLRAAYGEAYEAYRRSGVPFFVPSVASVASVLARDRPAA